MHIRPSRLLLATVLTVAGATLLGAEEGEPVRVAAHLAWESKPLGKVSYQKTTLTDEKPEGLETPDVEFLWFGRLGTGLGAGLPVALELQEKGVRMWVDIDGDQSLADETPIPWLRYSQGWQITTTVPVPVRKERIPVEFAIYRSERCAPNHMHVRPHLHRRGTVVLAGRVRPVALVDGDGDLHFNDPAADTLYLDLDGDVKLDTGDFSTERLKLGKPFHLRGRGYVATALGSDGKVVEFREVRPAPPRKIVWRTEEPPAPGRESAPPGQPLEDLIDGFDEERGLPLNERQQTLSEIGAVGTDEAFAFLMKVVREEKNTTIRIWAVRGMGEKAYRSHAGAVAEIAKADSNDYVRSAACHTLHLMDAPDRGSIYKDLLKPSTRAHLVGTAAVYLAYLGGAEAQAALTQAIRTLPHTEQRLSVYKALRALPDPPPIEILLAAARDPSYGLRANALRDLQRLHRPEARPLALDLARQEGRNLPTETVLRVLGGEPANANVVVTLLAMATQHSAEKRVREVLSAARDPETIASLTASLRSAKSEVRVLAAQILAAFPGRQVTDALIQSARREKDPRALAALLDALGDHQDPRALGVLFQFAKKKKDRAAQSAAIRALARYGMGDRRVQAFFLRLLSAPKEQDRIFALDAAAATGDTALVRAVLPSLGHKSWRIRLSAAEALGSLRSKKAIPPLIKRLEEEQSRRIRAAVAESLFRITGQPLYDFPDIWWRWWRDHGSSFRVPEAVPKRVKLKTGGSVATFYGLPVQSDRVVFVIDQSGSMSATDSRGGSKRNNLQTAVAEVLGAVGRLKDKAKINVILFESNVHPWSRKMVRLGRRSRAALRAHLVRQRPRGGTNLYDGLQLALTQDDVDTVFLLSDGMPSAGTFTSTTDILREVRRINQTKRIAIHCVAIGMQSALLKKLAAANGGEYVRR